jgi:acyl-coenzyme A synthetase/AMP-(fatty) acid ligase
LADLDTRLAHSRSAPALPLVWRDLPSLFARIASQSPVLGGRTGNITTAEFLGHCLQVAQRLPEQQYVINLCDNPYLFTVAFGAALLRRQTTLLPQNRSPETLRRVSAEYPASYLLHHSQSGIADLNDIADVNLNQWHLESSPAADVPEIERNFPAAIAFTSGSTGQPKPIVKPWHTLVTSSLMNGACMLPPGGDLAHQLATVPPQHMWGLETGVLIPLFWPVCVADSRPMFPADLIKTLGELPAPRLLVSTPVHLRALLGSNLTIPECARTLCATAPLAAELAAACESATGGDLREIYGCSEIGSTAYRRTAVDTVWRLIPGLDFRAQTDANDAPRIGGQHLPEDQVLQDRVEITADGFKLLGRNEDMVNVGGKRGSLMQITQVLLSTPGLADAVVFMPSEEATRPAALVVAKDASLAAIQQHFAQRLDVVFLPRPLLFVEQLPREETGKIHRAKVLALYRDTLAHKPEQ